jgi:hypothetical protein
MMKGGIFYGLLFLRRLFGGFALRFLHFLQCGKPLCRKQRLQRL